MKNIKLFIFHLEFVANYSHFLKVEFEKPISSLHLPISLLKNQILYILIYIGINFILFLFSQAEKGLSSCQYKK